MKRAQRSTSCPMTSHTHRQRNLAQRRTRRRVLFHQYTCHKKRLLHVQRSNQEQLHNCCLGRLRQRAISCLVGGPVSGGRAIVLALWLFYFPAGFQGRWAKARFLHDCSPCSHCHPPCIHNFHLPGLRHPLLQSECCVHVRLRQLRRGQATWLRARSGRVDCGGGVGSVRRAMRLWRGICWTPRYKVVISQLSRALPQPRVEVGKEGHRVGGEKRAILGHVVDLQ